VIARSAAVAAVALAAVGLQDSHANSVADARQDRHENPEGSGPQGRLGQFIVECGWSHSSFDDPIVHPGHGGASHRHDFFGNTEASATSTYEQLVVAPTTCQQRLDTAAYWAPSLLDDGGTPIEPIMATAYYRTGDGVDPTTITAYPPDLRMLGGEAGWTCRSGLAGSRTPPSCAVSAGLQLAIEFPDCWDGARIDSTDHRSHVAASVDGRCPAGHPVPIPLLELVIDYGVVDPAGLTLSSGPVSSAHADFWNTWDQDKLETEVELCLRRQQVCGVSRG
jgi:Domain of unknown function (DUF1996)